MIFMLDVYKRQGLTLVPGSLRAVRYAPVQGGIRNEAHLLTLPVLRCV